MIPLWRRELSDSELGHLGMSLVLPDVDVYTPWREAPAALEARHVGRQDELETIVSAVSAWIAGRSALPIYLFGPRGVGKSHLLAMVRTRVAGTLAAAGVGFLSIPEDIAVVSTAEGFLERIRRAGDGPSWRRFGPRAGAPIAPIPPRSLVFVEGFDRHLSSFSEDERRRLRRALGERDLFLLTTGHGIPTALTDRDTAFYASFQVHPVVPLDADMAGELLAHVAGDCATAAPEWGARQRALVALAGGSPRTILALGAACAAAPTAWASDHLYAVLRQFTAHYQLRFHDLPPQGQRIVEVLAAAPREVTPTEMGLELGLPSSAVSVVASRLANKGVLASRAMGRHTYYQLAEPLFRHWHEYRTAPWQQTRVALLGRLIEAVLSPSEIATALLDSEDDGVRAAIGVAMASGPMGPRVAEQLRDRAVDALKAGRAEEACKALEHWPGVVEARGLLLEVCRATSFACHEVHGVLAPLLLQVGFGGYRTVWAFERRLAEGITPREAFRSFVAEVGAENADPELWRQVGGRLVGDLDTLWERRGQPWVLSASERSVLANTPYLRATFIERGKLATHPPLLKPSDVQGVIHMEMPPDWDLLLAAAMRGGSEGLAGHLLLTAGAHHPVPSLPPNPRPGAMVFEPALFGPFLGARMDPLVAATWGAQWAGLPNEDWEALIGGLGPIAMRSTRSLRELAQSGLIAFGLRRPDRLDALLEAVLPQHVLGELAQEAALLAHQMQSTTGRVQPELALLRDLLMPNP